MNYLLDTNACNGKPLAFRAKFQKPQMPEGRFHCKRTVTHLLAYDGGVDTGQFPPVLHPL